MFRRFDRWVGRHMSAERWMVFWAGVYLGSMAGVFVLVPSAWACAFLPTFTVGIIMFVANAERRMK